MYALFIRRMSTKALTALIVLAGIGLASFAIFNFSGAGHLGVGVDDGRVQFDRWLFTSVIFFLDGIVDVARFLSHSCQRYFFGSVAWRSSFYSPCPMSVMVRPYG